MQFFVFFDVFVFEFDGLKKISKKPKQTKTKLSKANLFVQNNTTQTKNLEKCKVKTYALQKKEYQKKFVLANLAKSPLPNKKHCHLKTAKKKNISQQCWKYWSKYIVSMFFCVTNFA